MSSPRYTDTIAGGASQAPSLGKARQKQTDIGHTTLPYIHPKVLSNLKSFPGDAMAMRIRSPLSFTACTHTHTHIYVDKCMYVV